MTTTTTTPAIAPGADQAEDSTATAPDGAAPEAITPETTDAERPTVAVDLLTAHPGNVRQDKKLSAEFLRSIKEFGIRVSLLLTVDTDGRFLVIDGHRRLAAAHELGLTEVPYELDRQRADDEAGQYLDMAVTARHREALTAIEEADALFKAHQVGASKARIGRATGLKRDTVNAALTAATLTEHTRASVADAEAGYEWTLDELAALAEFEDDPDAVARIAAAVPRGRLDYQVQYERNERANAAERDRLRAELDAAGVTYTEEQPYGAVSLSMLIDGPAAEGEEPAEITPQAHADCPGHAAYIGGYGTPRIIHYCADPETHGHSYRYPARIPSSQTSPDTMTEQDKAAATQARRLVILGNKAWKAAGPVRRAWLSAFLARKTAPKELTRFVTGQLLSRAQPLRQWFADHQTGPLADLLGRPHWTSSNGATLAQEAPDKRLPLLLFATIAAAYEAALEDRYTWRTDRSGACARVDAGTWLAFLATLGYPLSPLEQAVADGTPYTGDDPTEPDQTEETTSPEDDQDEPSDADPAPEPNPDHGDADGDGEADDDEAAHGPTGEEAGENEHDRAA